MRVKFLTENFSEGQVNIRNQILEFLSVQRTDIWMDQLLKDIEKYNV